MDEVRKKSLTNNHKKLLTVWLQLGRGREAQEVGFLMVS